MAAKDMSIETQLAAVFREEASQARLPQRTWLELTPRMGEPETPNILWRLRHAFALPRWEGPGIARFAWPAAAVVFAALAVMMFVLFSNNNTDEPNNPAPAVSPTVPPAASTTAPRPEISRQQAAAIAEEAFAQGDEQTTAVENPHNMVLRLMRVQDVRNAESLPFFASHANTLVWIAQVEGTSSLTVRGLQAQPYRFNAAFIDAVSGEVIGQGHSAYKPFILPLEFLPEELVDVPEDIGADRNTLPVTRDEAVQLLIAAYDNLQGYDWEAIETALVRFSNPSTPGDGSIGPTAAPTSAGPEPTPTSGPPQPANTPRPTRTPVVERLSWLVIVPSHFDSVRQCPFSGPPSEVYPRCWGRVEYSFVDAETGNVYGGGAQTNVGPLMTGEEASALQRFAWAEGWWALWHEVHQYKGERLPEGLATQLDRPDAPTPTPFPPTATPPAHATATATPTPVPTPTPAASPTAAPMQINRVTFGSPVSGAVFEELLARMPDNDITRQLTELGDVAGTNARFGLELPAPGSNEEDEAFAEYVQRFVELEQQGVPVVGPMWPSEMRPYISQINWYQYVAFDFLSVTQYASASPRLSGQGYLTYDIAFGQFDPQATADALAACECDQPDIRVHNGTEFYAWGEELDGQLDRRLDPPIYDFIGRGPRLLVRNGEAYYTVADSAIENIIDATNGNVQSLADDPGYIAAARWLAALGPMSTMSFSSIGLSLAEIEGQSNVQEDYLAAINSAPLLKKFDFAATGTGYDGQRKFTGIVIANPDEATAAENANLLEQRLREGRMTDFSGRKWSELVELAEIDVQGRFVIARLYLNINIGSEIIFGLNNTLTISE